MEISVSTNQKQNGLASAGSGWPGAERRAAERSEDGRSGAPDQPVAGSPAPARPSPEVVADARRRTFSLDYKLRILKEAEAVKAVGGIGALLRREGLYSSHLTTWRQEREAGMRQALTPKTRGRKRKTDSRQDELQQLRREVQRLSEALQRAETIIDVQKNWGHCWAGRRRRTQTARLNPGYDRRVVRGLRHRSGLPRSFRAPRNLLSEPPSRWPIFVAGMFASSSGSRLTAADPGAGGAPTCARSFA